MTALSSSETLDVIWRLNRLTQSDQNRIVQLVELFQLATDSQRHQIEQKAGALLAARHQDHEAYVRSLDRLIAWAQTELTPAGCRDRLGTGFPRTCRTDEIPTSEDHHKV